MPIQPPEHTLCRGNAPLLLYSRPRISNAVQYFSANTAYSAVPEIRTLIACYSKPVFGTGGVPVTFVGLHFYATGRCRSHSPFPTYLFSKQTPLPIGYCGIAWTGFEPAISALRGQQLLQFVHQAIRDYPESNWDPPGQSRIH